VNFYLILLDPVVIIDIFQFSQTLQYTFFRWGHSAFFFVERRTERLSITHHHHHAMTYDIRRSPVMAQPSSVEAQHARGRVQEYRQRREPHGVTRQLVLLNRLRFESLRVLNVHLLHPPRLVSSLTSCQPYLPSLGMHSR
jgi:hypothetical protein